MEDTSVRDFFADKKEFTALLRDAQENAAGEWQEDFVHDLQKKFEDFGLNTFLSEKQLEKLNEIAEGVTYGKDD